MENSKSQNLKRKQINEELLIKCIKAPNDDFLAKLWLSISKTKIVCTHTQEMVFYKFDEKMTIYELITFNDYVEIIKNELEEYLEMMGNKNPSLQTDKLISRCLNYSSSQKIARSAVCKIYDKSFLGKLDNNIDEFHFANGYVDLRTGEFKKRTKDNFVSKCNRYDYIESSNKDVMEAIKYLSEKILNICNDDEDIFEFIKSFFGYCLTGDISLQISLFSVGIKASNGKSSLVEMFQESFPNYTYKFNRSSLESGKSKIHKDLAASKGARMCFLEEMENQLSGAVYKEIVGNKTITNEVLFGTTEVIKLNFKLIIISNFLPSTKTDDGIERRGTMINHTNEFLEESNPRYKPNTKGIYLVDTRFKDKFENVIYRNALFHIYLPYAVKFFKTGKIECNYYQEAKQNFKNVCKENDKMKIFIEQTFDTSDDIKNHKIQKDEFIDLYKKYANLNFVNWMKLLSDAKRCNLTYESEIRTKYNNANNKGSFVVLKLKPPVIANLEDGEINPLDDGIENINDKVNYESLCENLKMKMKI
jgi:phage/plasmid-associated DNA primase